MPKQNIAFSPGSGQWASVERGVEQYIFPAFSGTSRET